MQEYLSRTHLGETMDRVGAAVLMFGGSVLMFVMLWGLRLSALAAGSALGIMLLTLRSRTRSKRLHRREKALRRQLGGEIKMEQWLLMQPRRAHFETALLLCKVQKITLERVEDWGAMGTIVKSGERAVIFCAQSKEALSAGDIAFYQRICLKEKAQRGVICGAGKVDQSGERQAEISPQITVIGRERMIFLAGTVWPATDEQLVELGKRKRQGQFDQTLLHTVLSPARDRKYLLYGLLLCTLYLFSGLRAYLWPGCICLVLMALCRSGRFCPHSTDFL